jgi:hypothetical protein
MVLYIHVPIVLVHMTLGVVSALFWVPILAFPSHKTKHRLISKIGTLLSRIIATLNSFSVQQEWFQCVQNGKVFIIDHGPFARLGPRLIEGVKLLATVLKGVSPPPESLDAWKDKILKYQC